MRNMSKAAAFGAVLAFIAITPAAYAQDDLDDLLNDLESDTPAEKAAPAKPAPAATEKKDAEVKEAEPAAAEPVAEEKAEGEAAEAEPTVADEEPAAAEEKPVAEETPAEENPAEETAEAAEPDSEDAPAEGENAEEKPAEEAVAEAEPAAEEKPVDEAADATAPAAEENTAEAATADAGDKAEAPVAAEKSKELKVSEVLQLLDELAAEASGVTPEEKTEGAANPAVAAKDAPAVSTVLASHPDAKLLNEAFTTERLRRLARDKQAKREIEQALALMDRKEYQDAVNHWGAALVLLNDSPKTKDARSKCNQGIADSCFYAALQEEDLGRHEEAVKWMERALEMRHSKARRYLEIWRTDVRVAEEKKDNPAVHRKNEADYKTERAQIRKHLRRSAQLLGLRKLDEALEECEIVLVNDPYNQEAIRLRNQIQRKRRVVLQQEREATHEGLIADVDQAWRPVYAVNAAQLAETAAETVKVQAGEDTELTPEQEIEERMKKIRLPEISFKPPATIGDAIQYFREASKDFDDPKVPVEKRGFNFVLKTPQPITVAAEEEDSEDFSSNGDDENKSQDSGLAQIPPITASDISFYEALKLVCDSVDYKFIVRGKIVMVMHKDMSTAEILSRKYNVPEAFMERVTSASEEIKTMGGFNTQKHASNKEEEEAPDRDWKLFFEEMGVKWPKGSSIKHVKSLGKLYVRNTRENLAEFEKVLDELGGQPQLIEIETRFVEVSQEDLNSLGFEWLLNSDYALNVGEKFGKAIGLDWGTFNRNGGTQTQSSSETVQQNVGGVITESTRTVISSTDGQSFSKWESGGGNRNIGFNAITGASDGYGNGNRFLSTKGNHISGEGKSTNDQFMRVNAFLGNADLSLILHMLAQRSDTDLLSAPKVVTKSGENAVIKVVTEYIYPQDYDVSLSSSGSSGSSTSSSSSSSPIAIVEPQNFTMREQGVILDVTPTYSEANGGTIDLELKPQVVDEPTWHNYGMKIPYSGNVGGGSSLMDMSGIFTGVADALTAIGANLSEAAKQAFATRIVDSAANSLENMSGSTLDNMTYYDVPMTQPFFHVRSIDSKVSITPGSTVVMGGLITEQRKAMDDKVPVLGDLPFIGRLFRSHAEQTIKRNLLIFVTGRLITPSGRELKVTDEIQPDAEVKPAPAAPER